MREQGEVLVVPVVNLSVHMLKQGGVPKSAFSLWTHSLCSPRLPHLWTDEPVLITCCKGMKYLYMIFLFEKWETYRPSMIFNDTTYLSIHVTEHEIQQKAFALPEGPSHWQHHNILISDLRSQENPSQRICVQSKRVILLAHSDNLNWAWFTPHLHQSWDL